MAPALEGRGGWRRAGRHSPDAAAERGRGGRGAGAARLACTPAHRGLPGAPGPWFEETPALSRGFLTSALLSRVPMHSGRHCGGGPRRPRTRGCCQERVKQLGRVKRLRAAEPAAGAQEVESSSYLETQAGPGPDGTLLASTGGVAGRSQLGGPEPGPTPSKGLGPFSSGLFPMAEDVATDRFCYILAAQIHGKERPPHSPAPAEKMPGQAPDWPSQVTCPLWPGAWAAWLA